MPRIPPYLSAIDDGHRFQRWRLYAKLKAGRLLVLKDPAVAEEEIDEVAVDLSRVGADNEPANTLIESLYRGRAELGLASLHVDVDKVPLALTLENALQGKLISTSMYPSKIAPR